MRAPFVPPGTQLTLLGQEVVAITGRDCHDCVGWKSAVGHACNPSMPICTKIEESIEVSVAFIPIDKYVILRLKGEL